MTSETRRRATAVLAAFLLCMVTNPPARAQPRIKILVPSDDTCAALLQAANGGDATAMLSLGGWALGFLSGIAQQSGKDILHDTTGEGVIDQLSEACQREPNKPMTSIVQEMASTLLARAAQ